jgi:hypothetical protein
MDACKEGMVFFRTLMQFFGQVIGDGQSMWTGQVGVFDALTASDFTTVDFR